MIDDKYDILISQNSISYIINSSTPKKKCKIIPCVEYI